MNDRGFVVSPLDNGRDPADLTRQTISINKPDDNALMNGACSLIFYGHGGLFLASGSDVLFREQSRIRQTSDTIEPRIECRVQVREVDQTAGRRIGDKGGPIGRSQVRGSLNDITQSGVRRETEPEFSGRHWLRRAEQH